MNDHLLRDALTAHEHDVPDAGEVLANAGVLARRQRRRRRTAQATGGAVLGVGLVAGVANVPQLLASDAPAPQTQVFGAPATPTYTQDQAMSEYFNDGYDFQNATDLARLWQMSDITATKAEAGQRLLRGEPLPVQPHNQPAPEEDRSVSAFFDAGYTYDDAVELGKRWHMPDTWQVKIKAGHKVENGDPLPVEPSGK